MTDQEKAFARVLDLVEEAGCMPHVVLVGSWAEWVYREAGILESFDPAIKTLDVDFLVRNLRRPNPAASLLSLARERGFFVESDRLYGTTRLLDVSGLEVEFLIGKMGAGAEPALRTNVGVTAQTLRHMDILSGSTIETPCLGHLVRVPTPEAYALHKMIINTQRGQKAEKDAQAILGIWPHLNTDKMDTLLTRLTKKERIGVTEFMATYNLKIRDCTPRQ